MQSKQLTEFYQAYQAWLDDGAPNGAPFYHSYGLCTSLWDFCMSRSTIGMKCRIELENQFLAAGLCSVYPFNPEGSSDASYEDEAIDNTIHKNPRRIQWVKDHLNGSDI